MPQPRNLSKDQQKKAMADRVWLLYYNRVLFEQGLITERERNRMIHAVDRQFPSPVKR